MEIVPLVSNKVEEVKIIVDSDVDAVEIVDDGPPGPVCGDEDPDATEHSSSFDGTFSGPEDGLMPDSSDMEVESNGPPVFTAHDDRVFRKKKVTDHWRKFINPLLWRSRWLELRIRELFSQAATYDRELAIYNHEKQLQMAMTSNDKCAAREIPLTCRSRVKAMKRRKRRKIEDTVDIPSYMSQHVLFTYYDKRPALEVPCIDDGHDNQAEKNNLVQDDFGVNFEWPMANTNDDDKALEKILLDLESVQARVVDLRTQLSSVIFNNAGEALSASAMSIPADNHRSPSFSPRCSPVGSREGMPFEPVHTSQYMSDSENEEMIMPGSAVSSYGDAVHSDVIESTRDMLSSAISCGGHEICNLGTEASDDILINNQPADEEIHKFERATHQSERPQSIVNEEEYENVAQDVSSSETETDVEIAPMLQRAVPIPRRCTGLDSHLRRSKRKRKVRKSSPGGWSGEKKQRRKQQRKQEKR